MKDKTTILTDKQIQQKINRLAYQVYEENFNEKEIFVIGIAERGTILASRIAKQLEKVSTIKVHLAEIKFNKKKGVWTKADISIDPKLFRNKTVLLIDDVLNTGKVMAYACGNFLEYPLKKLQTLVLVDRNHHLFPIETTFVGLSLSTTLKEHVNVTISTGKTKDIAYLS